MSKRYSFEDILKSDFRWPMEGDTPFVEAADPMDNALIAKDDFARLVLMTDGYKRAADIAVAHCVETPADRDFWPAAGLMDTEIRCFIELEDQHGTKEVYA